MEQISRGNGKSNLTIHINITNKRIANLPPVRIAHRSIIPFQNESKYLGLMLDAKLQ